MEPTAALLGVETPKQEEPSSAEKDTAAKQEKVSAVEETALSDEKPSMMKQEATSGSLEEDPAHKEKKPRVLAASAGKDDGDDRKSSAAALLGVEKRMKEKPSAEEDTATKQEEKVSAVEDPASEMPALADEPAAGKEKNEKPPLPAAHKGKEARMGDEMKAPASLEKELWKNGHEHKPASAEKEGDQRKPPASAAMDGDDPVSAGKEESRKESHDDKLPASSDKEGALMVDNDKAFKPAAAEEETLMKGEHADDDEVSAAEKDKQFASAEEKMLMEGENDNEGGEQRHGHAAANAILADVVPPANPAAAVAPHLPLDIVVVNILSRLPSKEAGRCALVSKGCEERLRENIFFNAHLKPRRNFVPDEPSLLVVKPTGRGTRPTGYSHLCVINLASRVVYDMPVRTDLEEYHLWRNPDLPDPMVLDFFHKTITELDLSVLACEGHLLFGHSGKRACFFVCNATEGRFVKLPAPPLGIDATRAVAAIRAEEEEFSVVLLSPLDGPHRLAVHRFSSARDGPGHGWAIRQWENVEMCAVVQAVSGPGAYGTEIKSFNWISRTGTVLQYDPEEDRISLIPPPPPPPEEAYPIRKGWSLGSTADRLRVSCFSVGPQAEEEPHQQINMAGLISVWTRSQVVWEPVQNIPVPVQWVLKFFRRLELPIDAARGGSDFIVVKKDDNVLARAMGVEGDAGVQFLSNLFRDDDPFLHRMYESFQGFFSYL